MINSKEKIVKSAITAFLAMMAASPVIADESTAPALEKCYGVVKAGMNDCATATASCASSATKDKQADAFVFVPKGLCEKLVDGHLKPENDKKTGS